MTGTAADLPLPVRDHPQTRSRPVIEHVYREFLLQNHDPEDREYADAADQIREVLIHENYLSQKDFDICLRFTLAGIADRPEIDSIRTLHEALRSVYGPDDEHGVSQRAIAADGAARRRHVWITDIRPIGKEANELELIEAGLIAVEDEYLTECRRDIRDFLPEILRLIPANSIQMALNCSRRYAYSLRSGERKPSRKLLPKVVQFAARFARNSLREVKEPRIPENDEEAILRMVICLRNSQDPQRQ